MAGNAGDRSSPGMPTGGQWDATLDVRGRWEGIIRDSKAESPRFCELRAAKNQEQRGYRQNLLRG
jgi:hypothetical protein